MRSSSIANCALGLSATLLLFMGSSANGSQVISHRGRVTAQASQLGLPPRFRVPTTSIGRDHRGRSTISCPAKRVYVSDFGTNSVLIYPETAGNPAPCGTITNGISGPLGLYVDNAGMLYVANGLSSTVTEYPRNSPDPSVTLSNGVLNPGNVSLGTDGTLYVSEGGRPGHVLEFDKNAMSPSRTITMDNPEALSTDVAGKLYVSYNAIDGAGHVMMFPHHGTTGTDLGITVPYAGDVKLIPDSVGLLGDANNLAINVYGPGNPVPVRSISTPTCSPYHFAFDRTRTLLFVVPLGTKVCVYNYQSGVLVGTFSVGITDATGVALDPPAPPFHR